MSWLTNFVRPKLQALVRKADVPDNLWDKCPQCGQMIFHRELEAALRVCPHCGHHMGVALTGEKPCAVGEIDQDGARLGDGPPVLELENRDGASRIELQESLAPVIALEQRHLVAAIGDAEEAQQNPYFPAVQRRVIFVECQHGFPPS